MNAGKLWPIAIAGILGVTVAANIWMLNAANEPNAAVVEPDYYRKALDYDSTLAQKRENAELGWTVDVQTMPIGPDGSEMRLKVIDAGRVAVTGATVTVTCIHNLDAAHRPQVTLVETGDGTYAGTLPLHRPGFWEFRFEVERGAERFTKSVRRDVP